jgi:hypothetical protein
MRIAIIGGGWVGCHLARKLMKDNDVTLFEKNELFKATSYFNQNRLHLGYHYARNSKTRKLCQDTFPQFMDEYKILTSEVENNLYCVPDDSLIDYYTFREIFGNPQHYKKQFSEFEHIEGIIKTEERYIDFELVNLYFNKILKDIIVKKEITDIKVLSKEYDLVINATNNHLSPIDNTFYELTLSLLYKKIQPTSFGALTLVDGNFFSIYPYKDKLYTVTDVEHTPLFTTNNIDELNNFKVDNVLEKQQLIENKIKHYYPEFLEHFAYDNYFISVKSKVKSNSANRYPVIIQENNIVNCFTGKIQGIFIIEKQIHEIINWRYWISGTNH